MAVVISNTVLYDKNKHLFGSTLSWTTDTIKVQVLTAAYTPDTVNHQYYSDVSAFAAGTAVAVTGKLAQEDVATGEGSLIGNSASLTTVSSWRYVIVYKDTTNPATSPLLFYGDTGSNQLVGVSALTWTDNIYIRVGPEGGVGVLPFYVMGEVGFENFTNAESTLNGAKATVVVPYGSTYQGGGITTPTNMNLRVEDGGTIQVAAGQTFTITGTFEAGDYPVFDYVTQAQWVTAPRNWNPTATLVTTSVGNCTNGDHSFAVSFVTSHGETVPGYWGSVNEVTVDAAHKQISLTDIPRSSVTTGWHAVIGRNVYMTDASDNWHRVSAGTTLADTTTTTLTINVSDATLAGYPAPTNVSTAFYSPVVFAPRSIPECKAIWFKNNGTELDPTGVTDAEPQISTALASVYNYDTYYEQPFNGPACAKVRVPVGTFLIGHRVWLDTLGACLTGDTGYTTTFKINSSFPAAKTDLGYAPFWLGYWAGESATDTLRGCYDDVLENCRIDISCNNVSNTTEYACVYSFAHGRRARVHRSVFLGSSAGPNMRGISTERFCRDIYGNLAGSAFYKPGGGGLAGTVTDETVATGDGSRGPYFLTYSKYPRSSCTITADPSGSPQVVNGSDPAADWNDGALGNDAFTTYAGGWIYFPNAVAVGAPIKATYTWTNESYHASVNGSVWENIEMKGLLSPYGAIVIENSADSGDVHFKNVGAGGCYSFGTLGIGNNSQFDHCGVEMSGSGWNLKDTMDGYYAIFRITKGYQINFNDCYWDSPNVIYWLYGQNIGSGKMPYNWINVTGCANAFIDASFMNTSDKPVPCIRTGDYTLDVIGDVTGGLYNGGNWPTFTVNFSPNCWIVVTDSTNKNRYTYFVSAVSAYNSGTHKTTLTVDPTKVRRSNTSPPSTLPANIDNVMRISNQDAWFSIQNSEYAGSVNPQTQYGGMNLAELRVGLGQPGGFPWTTNQSPVGDSVQQIMKKSATGSGTVANNATGDVTLSVSNAYAGSVVFVSPGQDISGVKINNVRVPSDGTIIINITNNSGSSFDGAITWYYGGLY